MSHTWRWDELPTGSCQNRSIELSREPPQVSIDRVQRSLFIERRVNGRETAKPGLGCTADLQGTR
jgi:hypothetical protein